MLRLPNGISVIWLWANGLATVPANERGGWSTGGGLTPGAPLPPDEPPSVEPPPSVDPPLSVEPPPFQGVSEEDPLPEAPPLGEVSDVLAVVPIPDGVPPALPVFAAVDSFTG